MKVLYAVNTYNQQYVKFQALQIDEENETEYTVIDKVKIEEYTNTFPKNKLNTEFEYGFVTDKLDKEALKLHTDRIYNKIKEIHTANNNKELLELNDRCYSISIEAIERCVTPEEYEKRGLAEKEHKELMEKVRFLYVKNKERKIISSDSLFLLIRRRFIE